MRNRYTLFLGLFFTSGLVYAQTPSNCNEYTSTGTTTSGSTADDCAVPGMVPGASSAIWTGTGCSGYITSTVTGGPVSCLTLSYVAVNQNDYGTITTDTGGSLTITAVNAAVSGNVVGPFSCGGSFVGAVGITVCSTIPFNSVTLTNSGCSSGWVINCASQTGCGGGGGNAGADSTLSVCGGTLDLDDLVTGDIGGTWTETTSPASGNFDTGTAIFDAGASGVGTYTFAYEVTGGCAGADTAIMTINVNSPATATWTPPTGVCANDADIDLSTLVTGTAGGTWSGTGVTGNLFDPSVGSQSITYTVGTAPCDDVSTQTINVTPALDPSWTSPGSICEADGTIDLNALITGDTGGTWSGTGVSGSTFDPTGLSGPINVTYTIGTSPCIGTDQQTITVNTTVDPTWVAPTTLCDGDAPFDLSTTITGTTGGTWSGTGVTGNMFDPSVGTQTITYSVGVAPCDDQLALTINVGTVPDPSWTTTTLCASDAPINLNNTITGTTGGSWSGTGVSGFVFDPFFGTQSVTYTVTNGNCSASSTQDITVVDPQLTLSATNVTCFGETDGTLDVTVTSGSGTYTYNWNTAPPQTTASVTGVAAGTYTVTVTDGSCTVTDSITIIEPAEITANLSATPGCEPNLGSATVVASGGVGGFTYSWAPSGQTTQTATDLDSAMHTVIVTDNNGCTYEDSVLVQLFPPPNVTVTADTTIAYGEEIQLTAGGASNYSWTPSTALDCDDCPAPIASPLQDVYYCVTGIDNNGCSNEACMTLKVEIICGDIFVPSAFSPNDDGENDFLCVYSDCMDNMTFAIYNRWGEKVYETNELNICWDGTWNGKPLNSAVFVYVLDGYLINGELVEQKGNISLIR